MLDRLRRAIAPSARPASSPQGGLPWSDLYPTLPRVGIRTRSYRPTIVVGSSLSSQLLAAANPSRRSLEIYNASTAVLFVTHGPIASSDGGYQAQVAASGLYVIDEPGAYLGDVSGVWAAVNGSAQVTETT